MPSWINKRAKTKQKKKKKTGKRSKAMNSASVYQHADQSMPSEASGPPAMTQSKATQQVISINCKMFF